MSNFMIDFKDKFREGLKNNIFMIKKQLLMGKFLNFNPMSNPVREASL